MQQHKELVDTLKASNTVMRQTIPVFENSGRMNKVKMLEDWIAANEKLCKAVSRVAA